MQKVYSRRDFKAMDRAKLYNRLQGLAMFATIIIIIVWSGYGNK